MKTKTTNISENDYNFTGLMSMNALFRFKSNCKKQWNHVSEKVNENVEAFIAANSDIDSVPPPVRRAHSSSLQQKSQIDPIVSETKKDNEPDEAQPKMGNDDIEKNPIKEQNTLLSGANVTEQSKVIHLISPATHHETFFLQILQIFAS
ncbi:MAG: hypothetical protein EOP45_23770 [Sphingobacteriaceae bacterium]|nr:MAG: hypothetical protein EOP45_23770 [Sphingobacteriaceae bacterium]